MSDVQDLYQEVILDHTRKPRNFHVMEDATRKAEGYNPLCGDRVTIYMKMEDGKVADISFKGAGCAISTASASLMTESLKGKSREEVEAIFERFHDLVTGDPMVVAETAKLGKLAVFSGVSEYPTRVKCATLAWHTLLSTLKGNDEVVSTE